PRMLIPKSNRPSGLTPTLTLWTGLSKTLTSARSNTSPTPGTSWRTGTPHPSGMTKKHTVRSPSRNSNSPPKLNDYFGPERYEALEQTAGWQAAQASYTPWRADDNENHYDLFTAVGLDFIAVHLGFDVTQEELDWASDVLDEYSDRHAMVMT